MRSLFPLILICFISLPLSRAYASWIKCYIELSDPDAVIMHHKLVPVEQARANVTLRAWLDNSSSSSEPDGKSNRPSKAPALNPGQMIPLNTRETDNGSLEYVYDQPGTIVSIKLDASTAPRPLQRGIQFVIDIIQDQSLTEKAHFIPSPNRRVLCNGRRAIGTSVNIVQTIALYGDYVEIVGGWATEHEAVTLTKKVKFRYAPLNHVKPGNEESDKMKAEL